MSNRTDTFTKDMKLAKELFHYTFIMFDENEIKGVERLTILIFMFAMSIDCIFDCSKDNYGQIEKLLDLINEVLKKNLLTE